MSSKLVSIFHQDLDELFAYHTNIRLVFNSKAIGILFRFLQVLIIAYFIFVVYFVDHGYFNTEASDGLTIIQSSAAGTSRINQDQQGFWDSLDVSNPFIEGDNLFVATRTVQHYRQKVDSCSDYYRGCNTNVDCVTLIGEECKAGKCFGPNWCNSEGNTNTVEYEIASNYLIWIRSHVRFQLLDNNQGFTSMGNDQPKLYPAPNANAYSVADILNIANVSYREIKEDGAVLKVNVFWDCYATSENCPPTLQARRIDKFGEDNFLGANLVKYNYFQEGDTTYRNAFNMTGIKLIFDSKAKGKLFSFENLVLEIATMLAFLRILHYVFDFIIFNCLPQYQQYKQKKYIIAEEHRADEDITEMSIERDRRKRGTDDSIRASGEERKGLIGHDEDIEEESHDETERLTTD